MPEVIRKGVAMIRSYMMLLVALSLSCCAAPQGTTAVAPTGAPSSASTVSSVPVVAAAPQANAIVRLEAPACAHRGFLCGSCAVDGVWGALWVADDCSLQCNKWCGNQPAASVPTVALPALVSGPNVVELKVTLPTEVVTPRKSDQNKKKVPTAAAAESLSIVEKSSAFTYFATRDSVGCGLLGPATAAVSCNPPQVAHCGCEASGVWGKAACECRSAPAPRTTAVNNCHVDAHPNTSCKAAGVTGIADPGCATNCAAGYTGVCKESSCTGNTWTQSICACLPL